jgi:hypothetical protein
MVSPYFVGQGSAQKRSHPGTIVDAHKHKGIMAEAYAYSSQNQNKGTDCPNYGSPLDAEKSSFPSGSFTFLIHGQTNSYLAVYCEQGYAPRTETINDNRTDNTRVQPDPITLYPISGGTDVAFVAIATDLQAVHLNLTYYSKADSRAFATATQSTSFSDDDRRIIETLFLGRDINHTGPQTMPYEQPGPQRQIWQEPQQNGRGDARTTFVAVATDLNHARSDFKYYASVDEKGYQGALMKFSDQMRGVIEAIRTRPAYFGSPR